MIIIFIVFIIVILGIIVINRFSTFKKDRLLIYSMKMSTRYRYLYNSYTRKDLNLSKQEIYIKVLGSEAVHGMDRGSSGRQTLDLVKNQLQPSQSVTFRDIVKFLIIRKIHETPELNNLLEEDIIELFLKCVLLPENEKTKTGDMLRERGLSTESQNVFVQKLEAIERAVNTRIPKEL